MHGYRPASRARAWTRARAATAVMSRSHRSGRRAGSCGESPLVFVRDTTLHVTRLVGAGWSPSLSGDGRFVAFVGYSSRVPHIFVADLITGETRVITNSVRRGLANGQSAQAGDVVQRTIRRVSIGGERSRGPEDFNLLWDVFVLDRTTNAITRLSGDRDEAWMEPSSGPSIDANRFGRRLLVSPSDGRVGQAE